MQIVPEKDKFADQLIGLEENTALQEKINALNIFKINPLFKIMLYVLSTPIGNLSDFLIEQSKLAD